MLIYSDFNNIINKATSYCWYILQIKDDARRNSLCLQELYYRALPLTLNPSHSPLTPPTPTKPLPLAINPSHSP